MARAAAHRDMQRPQKRSRKPDANPKPDTLRDKKVGPGILIKFAKTIRVYDKLETRKLHLTLREAGKRGKKPVYNYVTSKLLMPFAGLLLALLVANSLGYFQTDAVLTSAIGFGGLVFGFYLPDILLHNEKTKRKADLELTYPDALDLLLICVEAGMSIEQALVRVGEEVSKTSHALAEEINITVAELSYLPDRRQAFANLSLRTGVDAIKSTCTALIQADKFGASVASSLRVIAEEVRYDRMARAETKAAALPPLLTVPMIVFFLPVLLVIILAPAALNYYYG